MEQPTRESGLALFTAGCTINNALRFRDMTYPRTSEFGERLERAKELSDYFQWEMNSLRQYALYLASVTEPAPVPMCPYCESTGDGYSVLAAYHTGPGDRRCIRCGRYFDTSNGAPREVSP